MNIDKLNLLIWGLKARKSIKPIVVEVADLTSDKTSLPNHH